MNSRSIITTLAAGVGFAIVDYRLTAGLAGIGAGNLTETPLFDFRGLPRPLGPGLDIGAYEFSGWRLETTGVSRSAPGELTFDFFSTFGAWDWSYKVEVSDDLTAIRSRQNLSYSCRMTPSEKKRVRMPRRFAILIPRNVTHPPLF